MSFFKLSTGSVAQSDGNFESGGGNLDPIPEGTKLRTIITEAKWAEYQGDRYINLRHDVADGEYKKRVIFQKIRVCETDTKKRDKALLKEFEVYQAATGRKLKEFRLEVLRAGFKAAWGAKNYKAIIGIAQKIPEDALQEDEKLLLWYDQALTRMEAGT